MKNSKQSTRSYTTVLNSHPARSKSGCKRALSALAMIGALVVAAQSAPAQQIFADWEADLCPTGFWHEIICWGAEPVPNNGFLGFTYVAGISDGNAIVVMNSIITLDGLVIFGGVQKNTMIIPNSRSLTIVGGPIDGGITGFIDNNDLLVMDSTGSLTELRVAPGPNGSTLRILGSGELRMSDNLNNRMIGSGGTIMFGTDQTVGGSGQIGANQLTRIINQGTIIADQTTVLVIDADDSPAGGMTNTGLMVARKGGTLLFSPTVVDNALGEIRAEDLSAVRFQPGAQITGGLMVAQSGGLFDFNGCTLLGGTVRIDFGGCGRVSAASSTVENVTNHGDIIHINTGTLHTGGQFNNTGNYFMSAISSATDLVFDSDTVLDGGGHDQHERQCREPDPRLCAVHQRRQHDPRFGPDQREPDDDHQPGDYHRRPEQFAHDSSR